MYGRIQDDPTDFYGLEAWDIEALLSWFINTCWQLPLAAIAEGLRQHNRITSPSKTMRVL